MTEKLRLDLPVLLPEVADSRDACVDRLESLIARHPGVTEVHLVEENGGAHALCMHYNTETLTLAQVERLARAAGAEVTERYGHAVLPIRAVGAEDAALRIEKSLLGIDGVLNASVSLPAQRARVEFERERTSVDAIRAELGRTGYASEAPVAHQVGCCHPKEPVPEGAGWYARNRELAWSLAAGLLLAVAFAGERWLAFPAAAAIGLYAASYAFGGWDLTRHWLGSLRKGRLSFDIDLLMLLAAIGAAVLGEWLEGAFLLFLFSLAHALEHYALGRARGAIKALADLAPLIARVKRGEQMVEVPVEEVGTDDTVVVRPAERIPVDGVVQSGNSAVNQAPITGESVPVDKAPGHEVFAGTVNGEGALFITTTRAAGDRTLDRVIKLVEEAQTQKAPTQQFTERFERVFVPVVLVADLLLIVVPPLLGFWDWSTSFYRGMALLVASSPCALALGTPSAVLAGIAQAARNGVLIKGGAHLENLGTLRALAFDKTGTLTVGKPEVTDLVPAAGVAEGELLAISAAVEQHSQHPLAQAVVRRAAEQRLDLPEAGPLESITARGVRSLVGSETVEIGSLRLWQEQGVQVDPEVLAAVERLQVGGRSTMAVRHGQRWLGVLGVADRPRDGVRGTLDGLRALGLRPLVMLTGDNRGVGDAIGREVGVDEVKAELLPEDKVTAIRDLLGQHGQVAMIGDGVNDAPALAHATVGIAMGGAGTAVALETADVALMGDDLGKLPFAVGLSRQARGVIRQNLYVSLGVIALLVVATTTGLFGIGPAVIAHEGSTLIVIANALRLLGYRGPATPHAS
ncbi:heavy metal translocating P-type ATPase [Longimicrobium sp.]|uniref:heavy metal translocating P-type ATPase n=1 Tax=Longimicrobium sp. TaxID=2029185 RepID=UPI002E35340A|nr:heavy metal translocating P-type ATPase [Longimicrobium sp.]HEX6039495.1 heavy metal translocating P-type ATPase [Longimicrobium sp.]